MNCSSSASSAVDPVSVPFRPRFSPRLHCPFATAVSDAGSSVAVSSSFVFVLSGPILPSSLATVQTGTLEDDCSIQLASQHAHRIRIQLHDVDWATWRWIHDWHMCTTNWRTSAFDLSIHRHPHTSRRFDDISVGRRIRFATSRSSVIIKNSLSHSLLHCIFLSVSLPRSLLVMLMQLHYYSCVAVSCMCSLEMFLWFTFQLRTLDSSEIKVGVMSASRIILYRETRHKHMHTRTNGDGYASQSAMIDACDVNCVDGSRSVCAWMSVP